MVGLGRIVIFSYPAGFENRISVIRYPTDSAFFTKKNRPKKSREKNREK